MKEWKKTHPDSSEDESSSEDEEPATKKQRRTSKLNPLQQFLKKNQPKKPNSAYILFSQKYRDAAKAKNPDLKSSQLMGKLAAMWKNVDPEEKVAFESKAKILKERYQKAMLDFENGPKAEFIRNNPGCNAKVESSSSEEESSSSEEESSDDDEEEEDEPKKRKVLTPEEKFIKANKPKNPVSAYIMFCSKIREEQKKINPKLNGPKLLKVLGAKWKEISKEDKAAYQEKAKALRTQYNIDLKKFREGPLAKWRVENKDKLASNNDNKKATKKRKVNTKDDTSDSSDDDESSDDDKKKPAKKMKKSATTSSSQQGKVVIA